jgi:hypothetical protein
VIEHSLKQSCFSQVLGDDNVRDRLEYKLYITCVCGACDVCVDRLTAGVSVEADKLVSDEIYTILVGVISYKKKMNKYSSQHSILEAVTSSKSCSRPPQL